MREIVVRTVMVPDYLATTDILQRSASNEAVVSAVGRWGERLSVGVTHALAADLTRRLPNLVIDTRRRDAPETLLLVDVVRLEIGQDCRCTLTARWRLTAPSDTSRADTVRGTFVAAADAKTDAAAARVMTPGIDQLAGQIPVTLEGAPAPPLSALR